MIKNKKLIVALAAVLVLTLAAGAFFLFFFEKEELICEDNLKFINSVDTQVNLTFCANPESYVDGGMDYDAQRYGIKYIDGGNKLHNKYYDWTVKTVKEYAKLNKNIELKFIEFNEEEYQAIEKKYPDTVFYYGDILVTATVNGFEKMQVINYRDIYSLVTDSTTGNASVGSCDIETALTSAIATVITKENKTIGIITGHSDELYTEDFKEFFLKANYEVELINSSDLENIPEKVDALVLATPTVDFTENELNAVDAFLENDGLLGRGLVYFASPDTASLPNIKSLLSKWGVEVKEGKLFETVEGSYIEGDPYTLGMYSTGIEHEISHMAGVCIVGNNAVLEKGFETKNRITVTEMFTTPQSTAVVPATSGLNVKYNDATKGINYLGVSLSEKTLYVQNEKKTGSVVVFSTIEFFKIPKTEFTALGNRDVVEAAVVQATNYKNQTMTFIPKIIAE